MTNMKNAKTIDEIYEELLNYYHELETCFVVYKAFGKVDEAEECYESMNEVLNIMKLCINKKEKILEDLKND